MRVDGCIFIATREGQATSHLMNNLRTETFDWFTNDECTIVDTKLEGGVFFVDSSFSTSRVEVRPGGGEEQGAIGFICVAAAPDVRYPLTLGTFEPPCTGDKESMNGASW
jgi:hypothetical protein